MEVAWDWVPQYWMEALFGGVIAALGFGYRHLSKRLRRQAEEQKALRAGVKGLLRDRIIHTLNHYQDRGYCPIYALENVQALHDEYKVLGGNGAMDKVMADIKAMPTAKPGGAA